MEAVYFGTYALFFGLAILFFVLSFIKWNVVSSIVFPSTSGVIWAALAVLSFTVYTDATTIWNQWAIAPICGIFAFTSLLIATYNVFEVVRESAKIRVDDE